MILLKNLSRDYDITCIDIDQASIERARKIRKDLHIIAGDATSRLVLEKAQINEADIVIITTTTEKINLEVARILHEDFSPRRVIAIGITQTGVNKLESYNAEVVNIFTASAVGIVNRLTRTKTTHDLGLGKNEIMEVEVHPNSLLANKPLKALAPIKWRIGIIYRGDNIIIPRKDTILRPKDRVIILGAPHILRTVAEILTFSFKKFPLEYGSSALIYVTGTEDESFYEETGYIISSFPVEKNIFICTRKAAGKKDEIKKVCEKYHIIKEIEFIETSLPTFQAIKETIKEIRGEQALVLISKKFLLASTRFPFFVTKKRTLLNSLIDVASCPIFLLCGTHPYTRILLPCFVETDVDRILETGIEISSVINGNLSALTVEPSRYIATEEEITRYKEIKRRITELGAMYKTSIEVISDRGNPIKAVNTYQGKYNLLVINRGESKRRFLPFLYTDVIWNIIRYSNITTVITPTIEEAL